MNSLCWNCWGIGNPLTVFALHDYVKRWNPKLVFLLETRLKNKHIEKVKYRLGFSNGVIVPRRGRSGGLALLWSSDMNLEVKSYSNFHIDAIITEPENGFSWRYIGFYGHPETTSGKNLGNSSPFLIVNIVCLGFVVVTLMKFSL